MTITNSDLQTTDTRPHSRACGWPSHRHGFSCSTNCPTCHGKDIGPAVVKAIDLNRTHLWHWVTVTDYRGRKIPGVLHRIEVDGDPRTRVIVRVMTREPAEGGTVYWSTFGDDVYLNPESDVEVGELLPENER
jgi:hypothetical protein